MSNCSPEVMNTCQGLIQSIYSDLEEYITLTFAQSLDGKLSSEPGKPFILSGKESLVLTHHLRTIHQGILIGANTCLSDNPKLTARFINDPSDDKHPIPIVLDSKLRIKEDCYLLDGHPKKCIVVTVEEGCDKEKLKRLEAKGAKILFSTLKNGQLDILKTVELLKSQFNIKTLMVEGGSQVIQSFLNEKNSFNKLIITIAPKLIGNKGVSVSSRIDSIEDVNISIDNLSYHQLGMDCILVGDPRWKE